MFISFFSVEEKYRTYSQTKLYWSFPIRHPNYFRQYGAWTIMNSIEISDILMLWSACMLRQFTFNGIFSIWGGHNLFQWQTHVWWWGPNAQRIHYILWSSLFIIFVKKHYGIRNRIRNSYLIWKLYYSTLKEISFFYKFA